MSRHQLKSIAQRGTSLTAAIALTISAVVPAVLPTASVFADELNPLTNRSLSLSSSSPGWSWKDGSGNTTYASPNSGANGKKTGNTFSFKVSTDSSASGTNEAIKAITFQYCTTSAGQCLGPGDNGYGATSAPTAVRVNNSTTTDTAQTSDLDVVTSSPSQIEQADLATYVNTGTGAVSAIPAAGATGTNFIIMWNNGGTWQSTDGWSMAASEDQYGAEADEESTGTNNMITLTNATSTFKPTAGTEVKVVFFATDTNYITNPGSGAFFVKINDYNDNVTLDATTRIDGGVTVANVMNQSIQIQTKVLETMDFSVGTVDPVTMSNAQRAASSLGSATHGVCDPILTGMTAADPVNVLSMGNQIGEDSLETDKTYSTHSYWRLSSNSSAGATVYYSGVTLSNTVGDQIDAIGATATAPTPGSEQFGLALANATTGVYAVDYDTENDPGFVWENGADVAALADAEAVDASTTTDVGANPSYHNPQLYPLVAHADYDGGSGAVNSTNYGPITTTFAFDTTSNTIPVPIASESTDVVDCVTGKMRYIANIAATTPAGIYTTKINYIAAPQY